MVNSPSSIPTRVSRMSICCWFPQLRFSWLRGRWVSRFCTISLRHMGSSRTTGFATRRVEYQGTIIEPLEIPNMAIKDGYWRSTVNGVWIGQIICKLVIFIDFPLPRFCIHIPCFFPYSNHNEVYSVGFANLINHFFPSFPWLFTSFAYKNMQHGWVISTSHPWFFQANPSPQRPVSPSLAGCWRFSGPHARGGWNA